MPGQHEAESRCLAFVKNVESIKLQYGVFSAEHTVLNEMPWGQINHSAAKGCSKIKYIFPLSFL